MTLSDKCESKSNDVSLSSTVSDVEFFITKAHLTDSAYMHSLYPNVWINDHFNAFFSVQRKKRPHPDR